MQHPLFVGWTPERHGGLSIIWLLVSLGGPVGREQQVLCEGSLGERHLLHIVEFWWGRGTGGASAQSREPVRGTGSVPRAALRMLAAGEPQSRPAGHKAGRAEFPCAPSCPALPAGGCLAVQLDGAGKHTT